LVTEESSTGGQIFGKKKKGERKSRSLKNSTGTERGADSETQVRAKERGWGRGEESRKISKGTFAPGARGKGSKAL